MIERVVVDTNVVSYFLRLGDTRAAAYTPHLRGKAQAISFVTVGELHRWRVLLGSNISWRALRLSSPTSRSAGAGVN